MESPLACAGVAFCLDPATTRTQFLDLQLKVTLVFDHEKTSFSPEYEYVQVFDVDSGLFVRLECPICCHK